MAWRLVVLIVLVPFLVGSDSRTEADDWADFLEEWLYGTTAVVADEDDAVARIEALQDAIFQAESAAHASTIWFASGSDELSPDARATLRELAQTAKQLAGIRFHLAGHTDAQPGRLRSNAQLSRARAERARAFLIDEGIAPERLTASGYADTVPIASNETAEGRAQNRRVDVRFVPAALSCRDCAARGLL